MARNRNRVIGPKKEEAVVDKKDSDNKSSYQGLLNPDGKNAKKYGSLVLGLLTVAIVIIGFNMFSDKAMFTGAFHFDSYGKKILIGGLGIGVVYLALHLDKKTSFKPFIVIGSMVFVLMTLQIISEDAFNYKLTLPNIGNSIFGAQYLADAKVERVHEKEVAKFRVMRIKHDYEVSEEITIKKGDDLRVPGDPYRKSIEDDPSQDSWIKAFYEEENGLYSKTPVEVPYRFLKAISSEKHFEKPEFSSHKKKKNVNRGSGYKIYQPRKEPYIFNLKAGETTDHWIKLPSGVMFDIDSRDCKFIITYRGNYKINTWEVTTLPNNRGDFKLTAVTDQVIILKIW